MCGFVDAHAWSSLDQAILLRRQDGTTDENYGGWANLANE
jgi:hypothetical protein